MTRTASRLPWRTAAVAVAVCALVGAGTSTAFAEDLPPAPLQEPAPDARDTTGIDPLDALRADPDRTMPLRLGEAGLAPATGSTTTATGSISGKVTYTDMTEVPLKPLGTGYVEVQTWDEATQKFLYVASAEASNTGAYTVPDVPPGTYYVVFFDDASGSRLLPEFYEDAPRKAFATTVDVADGEAVTGIDERLEPMLNYYIAGTDRYATSVAISKSGFAPDVACVYVASGANFPDALSAGPAATRCGGPLLLVPPTTLPSNVANELKRLSPERIVIAGGTGAVSSGVESKLKALAPSVKRIAGADRYSTSRKIVQYAFDTAPAMWVATGANFPDALAASAAGSVDDLPVLIVPGTASKLDSASAGVIAGVRPGVVAIAGGTAVVSSGVAKSIDSMSGVSVARFGGADRYQTALQINQVVWDPDAWQPMYSFMVNGTKFPDALAGAPLAGAYAGPMHVVPPTCTPAGVAQHLIDAGVHENHLLGYFSKLSFSGKPFKIC